ncbi:hypothetical protein MYX75_06895 [Acidobacteria bacterium AH-259-A15]|nr:hypothetical protein [Acidobacteria bacterium AH-259-A15]
MGTVPTGTGYSFTAFTAESDLEERKGYGKVVSWFQTLGTVRPILELTFTG